MIQTIKALTLPKRGLLVNEGEEVDWDTLFPSGFRSQPVTDAWSSERFPGSSGGVGSAAIMRDSPGVVRP